VNSSTYPSSIEQPHRAEAALSVAVLAPVGWSNVRRHMDSGQCLSQYHLNEGALSIFEERRSNKNKDQQQDE